MGKELEAKEILNLSKKRRAVKEKKAAKIFNRKIQYLIKKAAKRGEAKTRIWFDERSHEFLIDVVRDIAKKMEENGFVTNVSTYTDKTGCLYIDWSEKED